MSCTPGSAGLDCNTAAYQGGSRSNAPRQEPGPKAATGPSAHRLTKVLSGIMQPQQTRMSIVAPPVAPAPPPVVVKESSLPRHTQEQLLSLYLKYDGVSVDKIPNLVADLNLSIPVDFNIDKYFRNELGSKQLILQPQDLCDFVEDLQKVVGHPNDSVLDTCQVLAATTGPSVSPLSALDGNTSMSMANVGGEASRSTNPINSDEWSRTNNNALAGETPDYVERAAIEATLEQFFPPDVNIGEVMSHTVFRRPAPPAAPNSAPTAAADSRRLSAVRNAAPPNKAPPALQRQSLDQFRTFLVSDANSQRMEDVFRRCGATDEGYGLVLTAATLERVCQDRQRSCNECNVSFATIASMLDPQQTGDIELASFEIVVLEQLHQASMMAAKAAEVNVHGSKAGGVVASLLVTEASSSTHADGGNAPPPVAAFVASLAPAAVLAFTNRQTLDWLSSRQTLGAAGHSTRGGSGPSSSAIIGATKTVASGGKGTQSNGGHQGSPNVSGLSQVESGGGLGSNRHPVDQQSAPVTSATTRSDIDEMLTGIRVRGGPERHTALPRYMLRGPDDEITAAVKLRARQRKEADAQRAQSARAERHGFGLRLARVTSASTRHQNREQQRKLLLAPRLPDELDIDAVLQSKPTPRPPHVDHRAQPASSRLSQPKGYALLRTKRAPHEALSSATSSAVERFMINYDKDTPRGNDVTPIIENALAAPYAGGPPPHKISPRMAVLLADPYSVPPPRLHSAHAVHYVYHRNVDSWRVSPKRAQQQQHYSGDGDNGGHNNNNSPQR